MGAASSGGSAGTSGGTAGTAGAAGVGGVGGTEPVTPGAPGLALTSGGDVLQSPGYSLVLVTGEAPGGNGIMTSAGYRLQLGLVGTTQH